MCYAMDRRGLVLLVIVCVCAGVYAQVASLCRPNERFLQCGCPKTCRYPAPECKGVCKEGCFCEVGQFRNDDGICVKLADCPPIKSAYTQDTSEPRENDGKCPKNEEYRFCEPCNKSCENPNPICPAQCNRGCFCLEGMLRNKEGVCVKPEQCHNYSTTAAPIHYQMTCGLYQIYKQCETCERTCSDPNPHCPTSCVTGCFCKPGYVKAPDGQCVKLQDCPKAEMTIGDSRPLLPGDLFFEHHRLFPVGAMSIQDHGSPAIEDCASDEEYFTCGWCEPSCSYPQPTCPNKICTTGCLCRPPLLRHHSGHCVEAKDCIPKKCPDPNEEFVCHYGCERRCDTRHRCSMRLRRCELGCHCKLGLLRDGATGRCITRDKCSVDTISLQRLKVFNVSEPVVRYVQIYPRNNKFV